MLIGHNLHLHMARLNDKFLQIDCRIRKGHFRLRTSCVERLAKTDIIMSNPHPPAAAAGCRLDNHWIANLIGQL